MKLITSSDLFGHSTAYAPGKLNLSLAVGARDGSGQHQVASVLMSVSMGDEVTASPRDDGRIVVTVSESSTAMRDPQQVAPEETAVMVEAAWQLRELLGLDQDTQGVNLEVTKHLPIGGGMGDQAADTAATLLSCASLWNAGMSRQKLAELGSEICAEVPFSMMGGTAMAVSHGEVFSPILSRAMLHCVVAPIAISLRPSDVFSQMEHMRQNGTVRDREEPPEVDIDMVQAMTRGDVENISLLMFNDLQSTVAGMVPGITDLLNVGMDAGGLCSIVSGTGPTPIFMAYDAEDAVQIAQRVEERCGLPGIVLYGPVEGARLR